MPFLDIAEIEVLQLLASGPRPHFELPLPQRLKMGRLMASGLVRFDDADNWTLTAAGEAAHADSAECG